MKDLAKLLTIAFCISSCGENPKINGTWITSSAYRIDGKSEFVDIASRKILKTEGNTIRIRSFERSRNEEILLGHCN